MGMAKKMSARVPGPYSHIIVGLAFGLDGDVSKKSEERPITRWDGSTLYITCTHAVHELSAY